MKTKLFMLALIAALLFASVGAPDGLTPMPALGRGFSGNGDLMGVWRRSSAPRRTAGCAW